MKWILVCWVACFLVVVVVWYWGIRYIIDAFRIIRLFMMCDIPDLRACLVIMVGDHDRD
jgi:hypothetical protein